MRSSWILQIWAGLAGWGKWAGGIWGLVYWLCWGPPGASWGCRAEEALLWWTNRRLEESSTPLVTHTHTHTWRWSGEKHVQSMSASFETICNVTDWLTNHLIMRSIRVVKVSIYFDFKSWTMSNLNKPKYRSIEEALCFQGKVVLCDICHVKLALKCHGFLELMPRYTAPFLPGPEYRDQVLCTD